MKSYLIHLLTAVVAGTVIELIPPAGEGKDRPLRLIVSLLLLCTVALPLLNAIGQGGDALLARLDDWRASLDTAAAADGYAAQTMAYVRAAGADAAAAEIEALLAARFGIAAEDCRAEVALGDDGAGGVTLLGVKVWLSGRGILADAAGIEAYLAALFGGQAIVVIA